MAVVDVHTHMYPPSYVSLLESRTALPVVRTYPRSSAPRSPRLILLNTESALPDPATHEGPPPGRPLTAGYTSVSRKLLFMDRHGIRASVLSLANPWLDFVEPGAAADVARRVNDEFEAMCAAHPGRLYFFGTLPLAAPADAVLESVAHCASLPRCRGLVLGTSGLGAGLDDPALLPVFRAVAAARVRHASPPRPLTVFLHPHYGLPAEVYGPRDAAGEYGHVLPLAVGFPVETTLAVARMYLAGVFDAVPGLQLLLAHSGGTLPFLAGRIESCIAHDGKLAGEHNAEGTSARKKSIWDVLREHVYLDAVIYSAVGLRAAVLASGGPDRLMFGTDHPFFPPVGGEDDESAEWQSVGTNAAAVGSALGRGTAEEAGVMGGNAVRVLGLEVTGG